MSFIITILTLLFIGVISLLITIGRLVNAIDDELDFKVTSAFFYIAFICLFIGLFSLALRIVVI